jgi:hypothetical protein
VSRFGSLLALDARLLLKRALFRTVAAASLAAVAIAVLAAGGQPGGGWWRLAQAVRVVVPLLLSFGAILGAVSIAGDAASGSLRGVLTRPVSRSEVVVSRAVVLALGVAAVYAASVLGALLLSSALDAFGSIKYGTGEMAPDLVTREELRHASVRLIALALPGLVCAVLVGLAVGSCWNDPSSATICALLLVLSPYVLEAVFGTPAPWAFTHGATLGAAVLSDLAEGVTTRLQVVEDPGVLAPAVWRPLAAGAAAVAAGCAALSLRDFRA